MEHCGAQYIGALLLSDPAFFREICRLLVQNCGETIQEHRRAQPRLYALRSTAEIGPAY